MDLRPWPSLALLLGLVAGCGTTPVASEADPPLQQSAVVTLPAWDAGVPALEVAVPDGYTARTEKGRDFDIHFLQSASPSDALGSIYVGHNPGLLHRQLTPNANVVTRDETIAGESVRVFEFTIDGPRTVREATLTTVYAQEPANKKLAELRVHISVTGLTSRNVDTLWKYISTVHSVQLKSP